MPRNADIGLFTKPSRFTALLIILNISLFFAAELVTRQGYYYT